MKQLSQHIISQFGSSMFFGEPCGLGIELRGLVSGYTEI